MIMSVLFWSSFLFIVFTYIGYPVVLLMETRIFKKPVTKTFGTFQPFVSIVIAVKNEAFRISNRLKNLLEQDYPQEQYEIILVSDGSEDETVSNIQKIINEKKPNQAQIACHAYTPSKGKPTAVNIGVEHAVGEIIVFADARQDFKSDTVTQLVANFSDPTVGGVSGELVFLKEGDSNIKAQMGAYWKYEKTIRKLESMSGSVIGATGAVYAIRKQLYKKLPNTIILDDVLTPINIITQGYRVIFDNEAVAYDTISKDISSEWKRKVRTLAGNWQLIPLQLNLINLQKKELLFRFFFHKFARLFVPFFLFLLLITSALQEGPFFKLMALIQFALYLTAISAYFFPQIQHNSLIKTIYFFCSLNFAILVGFYIWLTGRCATIWSSGESK